MDIGDLGKMLNMHEIDNVEQAASAAALTGSEEGQTAVNAQSSLIQKKEKQAEEECEKKEDEKDKPQDKKKFNKPMVRVESEDLDMDLFFQMLYRSQSDRMDEQRAVLKVNEGLARSRRGKFLRSFSCAEKNTSIDYQPTVLQPVIKNSLKATKDASVHDVQTQRTTYTKTEEDFFDMVARMQGSRLEDQRAELPVPKIEEQPRTLPDDDFFNQLMSAQADRMDDQRATMPAKNKSSDKGESSSKK